MGPHPTAIFCLLQPPTQDPSLQKQILYPGTCRLSWQHTSGPQSRNPIIQDQILHQGKNPTWEHVELHVGAARPQKLQSYITIRTLHRASDTPNFPTEEQVDLGDAQAPKPRPQKPSPILQQKQQHTQGLVDPHGSTPLIPNPRTHHTTLRPCKPRNPYQGACGPPRAHIQVLNPCNPIPAPKR